jgi:hypothetical protein
MIVRKVVFIRPVIRLVRPATTRKVIFGRGVAGATGPAGSNGVGVPTGGSAGQLLSKINGTNYNTQWSSIGAILNLLPSYANDEAAIAAGLTAGVSWYILNDQTDIGTPWTLRRVAP